MKVINYKKLREISGISRTSAWRYERDPASGFPARIRIGGRCGWIEAEVLAWLASRPRGMATAPKCAGPSATLAEG